MGNRTFAGWRDELRGNSQASRARLDEAALLRRTALPGEVAPQGIVPEARLWLRLSDTSAAIASLESTLRSVRHAAPLAVDQPADNTARIGFLIQAIALHAILSWDRNRQEAREGARVAAALWAKADPELKPLVTRLREIAK